MLKEELQQVVDKVVGDVTKDDGGKMFFMLCGSVSDVKRV